MGIQDIRDAARLSLHRRLSKSAAYLPPGSIVSVPCSVRVMDVSTPTGDAENQGWARKWAEHPEVVFLVSEVVPVRGGKITLPDGAQYRVDNVKPAYGLTITAEVLRL